MCFSVSAGFEVGGDTGVSGDWKDGEFAAGRGVSWFGSCEMMLSLLLVVSRSNAPSFSPFAS